MLLLLDKICPIDNREDPIRLRVSYQLSSMLPIRVQRPNVLFPAKRRHLNRD